MRKKLLALLMCATMVLGTGVSAMAADVTSTDYTNAKTILKSYSGQDIDDEYDAKQNIITFQTLYQDSTIEVNYTWAFTTDTTTSTTTVTKVNPSKVYQSWTATNGNGFDIEAMDNTKHVLSLSTAWGSTVSNPSTTTATAITTTTPANAVVVKDEFNKSVFMNSGDKTLYYVTAEVLQTARVLTDNEYVVTKQAGATDEVNLAPNYAVVEVPAGSVVVTLKRFTAAETGSVLTGTASSPKSYNEYGIDVDGYIALASNSATSVATCTNLLKASDKIVSGYWVKLSQSATSSSNVNAVAQALADGTVTKDAVAVDITFYKELLRSDSAQTVAQAGKKAAYNNNGIQYGFEQLVYVKAEIKDADVTFNTDWLSRSSAKNANTVYILDGNVYTYTKYFTQAGTVYEISDYADNKFSTKYIASGTYIFDYVEDASQNDGVSDTDTTTTTTAAAATSAETAATSPKTGDVAPIAALAVVMMGACGAMVVASKKRA